MEKETALSIGNFLPSMKAIEDYVEDRTQTIYKMMATETDPVAIYRYQGSISELKKLLKIREDALKVLEQERINGRGVKEGGKKSYSR